MKCIFNIVFLLCFLNHKPCLSQRTRIDIIDSIQRGILSSDKKAKDFYDRIHKNRRMNKKFINLLNSYNSYLLIEFNMALGPHNFTNTTYSAIFIGEKENVINALVYSIDNWTPKIRYRRYRKPKMKIEKPYYLIDSGNDCYYDMINKFDTTHIKQQHIIYSHGESYAVFTVVKNSSVSGVYYGIYNDCPYTLPVFSK